MVIEWVTSIVVNTAAIATCCRDRNMNTNHSSDENDDHIWSWENEWIIHNMLTNNHSLDPVLLAGMYH